jgi:hypothetical protein
VVNLCNQQVDLTYLTYPSAVPAYSVAFGFRVRGGRRAYKGAVDKAGRPYILNPLAVIHTLETDSEKFVGVLHDVIEDSGWTFERLADEGFSNEIIEALRSVTKSPTDKYYFAFIHRVKQNPIGRRVKIADLQPNMDLSRISAETADDLLRKSKYTKAIEIIKNGEAGPL